MLWTAPPPARECHRCGGCWGPHDSEEPIMQAITTIGLDIAKSVFQVHGIDAAGTVVIRRQLKRSYVLRSFRSCRVPGWYRGLRHVASLVARTQGARPYRAPDAA